MTTTDLCVVETRATRETISKPNIPKRVIIDSCWGFGIHLVIANDHELLCQMSIGGCSKTWILLGKRGGAVPSQDATMLFSGKSESFEVTRCASRETN